MKGISIKQEYCKQCGYCVRSCPKGALSFGDEVNTNDYAAVTVDREKCVACGTCFVVCPDYVININVEEASA